MAEMIIKGGNRLFGEVNISGAKNAVLPILGAMAGMRGRAVLYNCPHITDVYVSMEIIRFLGGEISLKEGVAEVLPENIHICSIPEDPGSKMRSSITFCGGLLGRFGKVSFYPPGGCVLGKRPIDLHIKGFKALGAEISEENNMITAKGELKGAEIALGFPSVGATQNIMIAACFAQGTTVIENPSLEPETEELMKYLNICGGDIKKDEGRFIIKGVSELRAKPYSIMSDRIEAGTFMLGAAMTGGKLSLRGIRRDEVGSVCDILMRAGCDIKEDREGVVIKAVERPRAIGEITTGPYPAFPTDLQPQLTAMLSVAAGKSVVRETVFENRDRHIGELIKLGADIKEEGGYFVINGIKALRSGCVVCHDLRGGAAMLMAALAAKGESRLKNAEYIFRGYENIDKKIRDIGGIAEITDKD